MSSLRRVKKAPKNILSERKWKLLEGEEEEPKECLKYYYDNQEDFDNLNLPCTNRFWEKQGNSTSLESFNDVDVYKPIQMNSYIDKHFSNERFDGESPFTFQPEYKNKSTSDICDTTEFKLSPQQKFAGKFISTETTFPGMLVYNGLGSGKCLSKGTPLIKSDGKIIKVENVKVGDKLMGDDSKPRNVLSLGRGRDTMYEITPVKGDSFTCNSEHVLCVTPSQSGYYYQENKTVKNQKKKWVVDYTNLETLKKTGKWFETELEAKEFFKLICKRDNTVNISVKEYLKLSKSMKARLKLYRKPINFEETEVPIDPYLIGFWLGDGTSSRSEITSQDSAVLKYLANKLPEYKCYLQHQSKYQYRINSTEPKGNYFWNTIKSLNLVNNKHVPDIYKMNSRKVRLGVLAGLIDSDGHYNKNCYEFCQKNERTFDDVLYIARSLGFAAYKSKKKTSWTHKGVKNYGTAWRCTISGNLEQIPVKIKRKQATQREQPKDVLVTGFKVVEKPEDDYYGFTLDGNHRFLLGDFTVSHNTCTSIIIGEAMKARTTENPDSRIKGRGPYRVFIVVPKAIKEQYYEEIIGRLRDGTIVSCPGACVITENDDSKGKRQFYVGEYNKSTDQYDTTELNDMRKLEKRINKISKDPERLKEKKTKLELMRLNKDLEDLRDLFHTKVDTVYHIVSHDTFLNSIMVKVRGTERVVPTNFLLTDNIFHSNKSLLIIDEIQKLVREEGSKYEKLYNMLNIYARNRTTGAPTMKVVLLTATPVYDNPHEAALMIDLLRPRIPFPQSREKFQELFIHTDFIKDTNTHTKTLKNPLLLKYLLSGYVGYFKGGNPQGYPYRRNYIKLHKMQNFQQEEYTRSLIAEISKEKNRIDFDGMQQGMYPISIQKCNIAYSVKEGELKTSLEDIGSFMSKLNRQKSPKEVMKVASQYSQKFVDIIKIVETSPGPVFIYSKWIPHGIVGIYSILDALGWEFLGPKFDLSKDVNRYAIWSPGGLENKGVRPEKLANKYIKNMRSIFNSPENKDGKLIKVLLSNVVEGISLKGVNQVHVCEPWWNMSKMEQIIARAIRLCSHSHLEENRQYVDVYYHASILNSYPNYDSKVQAGLRDIDPKMIYFKDLSRSTIEQKMYIAAEKKQNINVQFELALKQSAVDCILNKDGNIIRLEEMLIPSIKSNGVIETDGIVPLYNRSNNKYYFLENKNNKFYLVGLDIQNAVSVPKLSRKGGEKTVHNWPPVSVERTKNVIQLEPWQIKVIAGNTSVTLLENTLFDSCDIRGPVSDMNFKKMYKYAVSQGEDPKAWVYCYDMFRKTELFGKIAVKYNLITAGSPVPLQNKLYSLVQNASSNGVFDSLSSQEKKKHITTLEALLLRKEALKNKQELINNLYSLVPEGIRTKLNNYSYIELTVIKEKLGIQKRLRNKAEPEIVEKLDQYSIEELRVLNKKYK